MENTLTIIDPKEFGLEETKAVELTSGLKNILAEREILVDAYNDVIDLEITPENLQTFKSLRIKIRDNRTKGIEKWHKVNKEFFLTGGRFVDAIKNKEVAENERMEEKLAAAEKYFDNLEKERLKVIHNERVALLVPFGYEIGATDFSAMDENMFNAILTGAKTNYEAKFEAERKAEEERQEEEMLKNLNECRKQLLFDNWRFLTNEETNINFGKIPAEEFELIRERIKNQDLEEKKNQEAQRLENERLRQENESKEKALAEQKAAADEALRIANEKAEAERKEQAAIIAEQKAKADKLAAELKNKADAEAKAEAERIAAEKKAAKAPDKEKLKAYVLSLKTDMQFDLKTMEAARVMGEINVKLAAFKKWANDQIEML